MDRTQDLPFSLSHSVVEVFICNANKGELLKKSSKNRKVTSFYENPNITDVLPLMTQPFDAAKMRSLFCIWEEELVFNESLNYLRSTEHDIIYFFQLKDFSVSQRMQFSKNGFDSRKGKGIAEWRTFAWAFLKMIGSNGHENLSQLRLQLYKPRKINGVNFCDLYSWWKSGSRRKYNSSLHVTLREITLPENPNPSLRSFLPNQKETGKDHLSPPNTASSTNTLANASSKHSDHIEWERQVNQQCKIPNNVGFTLSTFNEGCMVVKFSHDGTKLACGTLRNILIYNVLNGLLVHYLRGHLNLIYELNWSFDDNFILSCSADATARVWTLQVDSSFLMEVLTHPSYVYAAKLDKIKSSFVVTGCYDNILRVWVKKSEKYTLIQELSLHLGYISAICFNIDGSLLYSADKQGIVSTWKVNTIKKRKKDTMILEYVEKHKLEEIYGVPINHICCHPGGHRILVHTRDSQMRFINLKYWTTTQKFKGILNSKEFIKSSISPCGSWVISGSEDGCLCVWDSETGNLISSEFDLPFHITISCVDFHPFDHMMAVCSHFSDSSVLIMKFDSRKTPIHNVPITLLPVVSKNDKSSSNKANLNETKDIDRGTTVKTKNYFPDRSATEILSNIESSKSKTPTKHWKDVGRELLTKLDFILKTASEETSQLIQRERKRSKLFATAVYSYKSTAADEASLKKGEFVIVIKRPNGDWWLVEKESGIQGLVPSSYLLMDRGKRNFEYKQEIQEMALRPRSGSDKGLTTPARERRRRALSSSEIL